MKIVIYGKSECVQCHYTKVWLDRPPKLQYEYIDIEKDAAAEHDAKKIIRDEKLNTTWPLVIVSNGYRTGHWTGFRIDRLKGLRETGNY